MKCNGGRGLRMFLIIGEQCHRKTGENVLDTKHEKRPASVETGQYLE